MRIAYGAFVLGDDAASAEISALSAERTHTVETVPIIRAKKPLVVPRGNALLRVSFTVAYYEASRVAALSRQLFGYGNMWSMGSTTLWIEEDGNTFALEDATLESMPTSTRVGRHAGLQYVFIAPYPHELWGWPDDEPEEPEPIEVAKQVQADDLSLDSLIATGMTTLSITFAAPFSEPPHLVASISPPDGEPEITAEVVETTTTGATISLSATPAATGYQLEYMASIMPAPTDDSTMILADIETLTTGTESVNISWAAQPNPPDAVNASYLKPAAGADNILAVPVISSISTTGMTVELSAPAEAGASLAWSATFTP